MLKEKKKIREKKSIRFFPNVPESWQFYLKRYIADRGEIRGEVCFDDDDEVV
jgi:hypothetical protein